MAGESTKGVSRTQKHTFSFGASSWAGIAEVGLLVLLKVCTELEVCGSQDSTFPFVQKTFEKV